MRRVLAVLGVALTAGACAESVSPVHLEPGPPLKLEAAPGFRINARLKPALELSDGAILRFDSPHKTADSAYFTEGPTATPPRAPERSGLLRASVCATGKDICRVVVMRVTW